MNIPKQANVESTLAYDPNNAIKTQELKPCLKIFKLILKHFQNKYFYFFLNKMNDNHLFMQGYIFNSLENSFEIEFFHFPINP